MNLVTMLAVAAIVPNTIVVDTHYVLPEAFETSVVAHCKGATIQVSASSKESGAAFTQYKLNGQEDPRALNALNKRVAPIKSISSLRVGCVANGAYIWTSGYADWQPKGEDTLIHVRAVVVDGSVY
jgi:hypothetical protein